MQPSYLNDDRLVECWMQASQAVGLECQSVHLDSTSFSVSGHYEQEDGAWVVEGTPVPIAITHGYSRDHRPDLQQ